MSLDYVERRIQEALRLTNGNTTLARQQVVAWTYEDSKLLHELAKPHLSGIVAYHIERVASGRSMKAKAPPKSPVKKAAPKQSRDEFGLEILKALVGSENRVFGLESAGSPGSRKRGQASITHVDAIRRMAAKSKKPSGKK